MRLPCILFFIIVFCHQCCPSKTNCTEAGNFLNNLSNDCRSFSMCLMLMNSFTSIDLFCPKNSIYSHTENQCTNITEYQCLPEYNCTDVGDFPDPTVNDCSSYISCAEGLDGIGTARLTVCPPEMMYNPTTRACVNKTMFECLVKTQEPPTIFEESETASPVPDRVNSTNSVGCKKADNVAFIILLILCLFNKIL